MLLGYWVCNPQPLGLSPVMVIDGDKNVIAPEPRWTSPPPSPAV